MQTCRNNRLTWEDICRLTIFSTPRCLSEFWSNLFPSRSSCSQMFFEIGVLETSANFTGKHLCLGLFLIQLQVSGLQLFLKKETLTQVFFCEIFEIFKNTFFTEHLRWILLAFWLRKVYRICIYLFNFIFFFSLFKVSIYIHFGIYISCESFMFLFSKLTIKTPERRHFDHLDISLLLSHNGIYIFIVLLFKKILKVFWFWDGNCFR